MSNKTYVSTDLRDPSTTPLNFTKSINLALSERGVNAMRHARCEGLLDAVIDESIPMHGRMIHGQSRDGKLYEEPQVYDAQGRVKPLQSRFRVLLTTCSIFVQSIGLPSTNGFWTISSRCQMFHYISTTS